MAINIIGVGVGRTGSYSLKLALEELNFGPCHHMEEVASNLPVQLPLWQAALAGRPDWPSIYSGYNSAVDWPTARFFRELNAFYPEAKFILGYRDSRRWAESFSETIYKLLSEADQAPDHLHDWLAMAGEIVAQTGIPAGADVDALEAAFIKHGEAVKAAIPANRLLVHEVKQGWEPLCAFLGVPVPDKPFPKTNNRSDFWDLIKGVS
ncbi:MAG: sulfotransferase family protein [Pseudomonadota bacterium]